MFLVKRWYFPFLEVCFGCVSPPLYVPLRFIIRSSYLGWVFGEKETWSQCTLPFKYIRSNPVKDYESRFSVYYFGSGPLTYLCNTVLECYFTVRSLNKFLFYGTLPKKFFHTGYMSRCLSTGNLQQFSLFTIPYYTHYSGINQFFRLTRCLSLYLNYI